jgi:hypothetical protein
METLGIQKSSPEEVIGGPGTADQVRELWRIFQRPIWRKMARKKGADRAWKTRQKYACSDSGNDENCEKLCHE